MMGATVKTFVHNSLVGRALRRLEHHADVFLHRREKLQGSTCEVWHLRSDKFPSEWEGMGMNLRTVKGNPGIETFEVRSCQ